MKNTLYLSILAAALLGGQAFAEPVVYSVDKDWSVGQTVEIKDMEATVLVDAQKALLAFTSPTPDYLTLDFRGEYVLNATLFMSMPNQNVLNITSTVDSVESAWEETFSVDGGGSITLCSAGMSLASQHGPVQFFGTDADNTVQLGDSEVLFKGVVDALSDLEMNEVGLVWGSKDITLVGKVGASPTPEPTTGTLSLLALAGLCIRRRK